MRLMATLAGVLAIVMASAAQPLPPELYSLKFVEVIPDTAGATNWQILMRTATNALPVAVIESPVRKVEVSNLQYGATYYLSAKQQIGGVWSKESPFYTWPHPQTNYASYIGQTSPSVHGIWKNVPGSLRTEINPAFHGDLWRVKIWYSNNIAPYVHAQ